RCRGWARGAYREAGGVRRRPGRSPCRIASRSCRRCAARSGRRGRGGARSPSRSPNMAAAVRSPLDGPPATHGPKGVGSRTTRVAVVAGALLLALATRARGADYWVKNGGDDGHDGLSVGTAWATLVHAAATVGPGDTVHILDGSYQGFYLTTSGA